MAIPYTPPYSKEKLDSEECQTLIEILRSEEQWGNPERQMLACHLHHNAGALRKSMQHLQKRISHCQADEIEQDLEELEEIASQLARLRKEMKAMQEKEEIILTALHVTKNRLANAEFNKKIVEGKIGNNLLTELCKPELKAAGFEV